MKKLINISILFSLILLKSGASYGQVADLRCIDRRGSPVAVVPSMEYQTPFLSYISPSGQPLIFFNPIIISSLQRPILNFFFARECGVHQSFSHSYRNRSPQQEMALDCWAINTLIRSGELSPSDIPLLQNFLGQMPNSGYHSPGPNRARTLRQCLRQ